MTSPLTFLRQVVDECITVVDYDEGTTIYRDPYPAMLLGHEFVIMSKPYWWERRGKLTLFELPECDQATELKERTVVTLAHESELDLFQEGMVLSEGNGHEYLCGRCE